MRLLDRLVELATLCATAARWVLRIARIKLGSLFTLAQGVFPMNRVFVLAVGLCCSLTVAAKAETKVTLKGVHLCCGQCVKIIGTAVSSTGAKATCDQDAGTVTITAADEATAKKAIAAMVKEGFHGTADDEKLAIKDDSGAGKDKVQRLKFSGAHNCCGNCATALKSVVTKVDGVTGTDVKAKAKAFVVEGDFSPADVVKALNEAGFHVKVEK